MKTSITRQDYSLTDMAKETAKLIQLKASTQVTDTKKMFEQIEPSNFLAIECPDCKESFGLDVKFVENASEMPFHYKCPYCGAEHQLK